MTKPFEPIPDSTQVHVDRLVGGSLGACRVVARAAEGRYGTLYRAEQGGKPVTLEVLRMGLVSNDDDVRAANSIKCDGIAKVLEFGEAPDGRRFRVMELLEGESLEAELQRKGRFTPAEAVEALKDIATVLQASHAWAITHGRLGASSVLRTPAGVKLIDFGLVKSGQKTELDLQALGMLGFTLLTGKEVEGAPPPLGKTGVPELFDRFLRELIEGRVADATEAKNELETLLTGSLTATRLLGGAPAPATLARPSPAPARSRAPRVLGAVLLLAVAGAGVAWLVQGEESAADGDLLTDEELEDTEPEEDAPPELPSNTPNLPNVPNTPRPSGGPRRTARPVPTAQQLQQQIARLEAKFHKQGVKRGDDVDQALFVLNKQRLRLTGNPSEADRRDVAKQLAGWRRSYLR